MKGLLALCLLSASVTARSERARRAAARASASATEYDYIVVGGGTSGLVVANRLSEDPSVSVLVVERGDSVYDNPNVTNTDGYGYAFGTDIDYQFQTVPQRHANNASTVLRAGKALGGTSTINGLAYTRAEKSQIDAWQTIGNDGWNWSTLYPYYLKSETFQVPDQERVAAGHIAYDADCHGDSGPVYTAFAHDITNDSYPIRMNTTYKTLGVSWDADGSSGNMVGFSPYQKTIHQDLNVRWDAARAYYYPYQDRPNLHVLLNTTVNKLTWSTTNGTNGTAAATASGVEIASDQDGASAEVVRATKEVILSAGALVSPLLLELSGVGNPAVLAQHGIAPVVALPTVGENLQDQINNELKYTPRANFTRAYDNGSAQFVAYPSASHVLGGANASAAAAAHLKAELPSYAAAVAAASGNVTKAADLLSFFELQHDLIFGNGRAGHETPYAEILISLSAGGVWAAEYWGLLPFSRGSVHISRGDSTADAAINPSYFMLDYDVALQVETAKFIRAVFATEPFASVVGAAVESTPAEHSDDAAAWRDWVVTRYRSNFHPVATAAMMPRERGGVVDAALRVYGTSNVRVVDASVLPFQVCGHLTSTLYAVAERAADLIKGRVA